MDLFPSPAPALSTSQMQHKKRTSTKGSKKSEPPAGTPIFLKVRKFTRLWSNNAPFIASHSSPHLLSPAFIICTGRKHTKWSIPAILLLHHGKLVFPFSLLANDTTPLRWNCTAPNVWEQNKNDSHSWLRCLLFNWYLIDLWNQQVGQRKNLCCQGSRTVCSRNSAALLQTFK